MVSMNIRKPKKRKAKPRLRKNPCADYIGESQWQAIAPRGWHFNKETSYCATGKCVYLCLERDRKEADRGPEVEKKSILSDEPQDWRTTKEVEQP